MPRPKIPTSRKHRSRPISLPPAVIKQASKRAFASKLSFSRYVLTLIERDLARPVSEVETKEVAA